MRKPEQENHGNEQPMEIENISDNNGYTCNECDYKSTWKTYLTEHKKKKHKKKKQQ